MKHIKTKKTKYIEVAATIAANWWIAQLLDRIKEMKEDNIERFDEYKNEVTTENLVNFRLGLIRKVTQNLKYNDRTDLFCSGIPEGSLKEVAKECGMSNLTLMSCGLFPVGLMVINQEEVKVLNPVGKVTYYSLVKNRKDIMDENISCKNQEILKEL